MSKFNKQRRQRTRITKPYLKHGGMPTHTVQHCDYIVQESHMAQMLYNLYYGDGMFRQMRDPDQFFIGVYNMGAKQEHTIPKEYETLPWKKKRVLTYSGKVKYIKCYWSAGPYWIGENTLPIPGYFNLCLNTLSAPFFWSHDDFGQLRVSIDWLLDNGIDLSMNPEKQYNSYCELIKKFWPDELHRLCTGKMWVEELGKVMDAEIKFENGKIKKEQINRVENDSYDWHPIEGGW